MLRRIRLLLPCDQLDDFPAHQVGEDAEGVLANWTAGWHPALIAAGQEAPKWVSTSGLPAPEASQIWLRPTVARYAGAEDFEDRVLASGGVILADRNDRCALVGELLELCHLDQAIVDDELVADFFALGYWYLQVELLTRQMRHTSNLDGDRFGTQVLKAAGLAVEGKSAEARDALQTCFNWLADERNHYYAVEAYLLDWTLVAETSSATAIRLELNHRLPVNLALPGETLEGLVHRHPELVAEIAQRWKTGQLAVLGGEYSEMPLPLMSLEAARRQLERGVLAFRAQLDQRPRVFCRRRFGMSPVLASLLGRMEWTAAIHGTLDAGRYPESAQARTQWQGPFGSGLDALGSIPLDASRPETFLKLSCFMSESMGTDYVATVCLAHWAGQASPWYEDLRRGARYSPALGRFVTADEYFSKTGYYSHSDRFTVDQYQSPYLEQAVEQRQPNPISRWGRWWRRAACLRAAQDLAAWTAVVGGDPPSARDLAAEVDTAWDRITLGHDVSVWGADAEVDDLMRRALSGLAQAVGGTLSSVTPPASPEDLSRATDGPRGASDHTTTGGWWVANPFSWPRRVHLTLPLPGPVRAGAPVYASATAGGGSRWAIDVPAAGFAWLAVQRPGKGRAQSPSRPDLGGRGRRGRRGTTELVEGTRLCNEFIDAHVDPVTGGLRALYDYRTRGNRLSQRLVWVASPPSQDTSAGSGDGCVMRAEGVETVTSDELKGELRVTGHLLSAEGELLADFQQHFQLWRGSRVLRIRIQLAPHRFPTGAPWTNYLACRWAWPSETDRLFRSVQEFRFETTSRRCETPLVIEIENEVRRTCLLPGGLPFHCRSGPRTMDSLLIVAGETQTRFDLDVGVDLPAPQATAWERLMPPGEIWLASGPPLASGWLFHVDAKHVVTTNWQAIWASDDNSTSAQCVGCRVRLVETSGRSGQVTLRLPRRVDQAVRRNLAGGEIGTAIADGNQVEFPMQAHEFVELECRWSSP